MMRKMAPEHGRSRGAAGFFLGPRVVLSLNVCYLLRCCTILQAVSPQGLGPGNKRARFHRLFHSKMKECPSFLIRSLGKSHLGWPVSDHGPAAPVFTAYAMKSAAAAAGQ